jgi:hypothetical protein
VSTPRNSLQARASVPAGRRDDAVWRAICDLVAEADVAGLQANKLGPIAAHCLRARERPVPSALERDARQARAAWMASRPLLERIRSLCDGPLVLIKGAEVAALYPERARSFSDLDILCPDANAVHAALLAGGFVEVDDPEVYTVDQHHLRPLQWPGIWLWVEVHLRPLWPRELRPPSMDDIVSSAVPSATGVAGISAPAPAHHAVILASHSWVTMPLGNLRDLVDVAAVAAQTDEATLAAAARQWGVDRLWRTTYKAASGLLGGGDRTVAVRVWARHLPGVREYNVLDNHLKRWLNGLWGLPPRLALRSIAVVFRQELFPYPDESWRDKFIRVRNAFTKPRAPMSVHTRAWQKSRSRRSS